MGRFRDGDIDRVREATDLISLVSETVVLKQKGRLFWGNCPFHGEKTPSFKIDPTTQLWHCFGCGKGGDAFGYVMESEHLDFPDAVRRLAERGRVEIVEEGGSGVSMGRKERLIAACEAAANHFHRDLTMSRDSGATTAREYLAKRGFGSDVAKRWRLGFAASGRDTLVRALLAQGFTREELIEANLALADGGSLKDRFFNRIMFPIADMSGRTIAFGGRVVDKGEPKYLNSQETPIFHKSATLYGLDRARNSIVMTKQAIVVEGYTDVIALAEAGITNVVATLGTALTERHVKLLGRFGERVVYLFDGDEAGRRAAMRAGEFMDWHSTADAGRSQVDLAVALIPDGQDPADYVETSGVEKMRTLIDGAAPLMRFILDERIGGFDTSTPEGKSKALSAAATEIAKLWGTSAVREYAQYVAGELFVDTDVAFGAVERAARPKLKGGGARGGASQGDDQTTVQAPLSAQIKAERELVRLAAIAPALRAEAQRLLAEGALGDVEASGILSLVIEAGEAKGMELFSAVADRDPEASQLLSGWLVDAQEVEQVEYAFREVAARVQELALGRRILSKKAELRSIDPKRDSEAYDRLFSEIAELQRAQQVLRERGPGAIP